MRAQPKVSDPILDLQRLGDHQGVPPAIACKRLGIAGE
jgi:hypothetical protein